MPNGIGICFVKTRDLKVSLQNLATTTGWRLVGFPGAHPAFTPADMESKEAFAGGALIGLQAQAPMRRT